MFFLPISLKGGGKMFCLHVFPLILDWDQWLRLFSVLPKTRPKVSYVLPANFVEGCNEGGKMFCSHVWDQTSQASSLLCLIGCFTMGHQCLTLFSVLLPNTRQREYFMFFLPILLKGVTRRAKCFACMSSIETRHCRLALSCAWLAALLKTLHLISDCWTRNSSARN